MAPVASFVAVDRTRVAERQTEAKRQAATALTRQLLAEASYLRTSQPDLGVLLNVEAVHPAPDTLKTDAVVELRQSLNRSFHVTAHLIVHADAVNAVVFSKDGSILASGSNDWTAQLRDTMTGKQIREPLRGHGESVHGVAFNPADPGGGTLVTASDDGTVRRWDTHSGQQTGRPLVSGEGKVGDIAFNPDRSLPLPTRVPCTCSMCRSSRSNNGLSRAAQSSGVLPLVRMGRRSRLRARTERSSCTTFHPAAHTDAPGRSQRLGERCRLRR